MVFFHIFFSFEAPVFDKVLLKIAFSSFSLSMVKCVCQNFSNADDSSRTQWEIYLTINLIETLPR